MSKVVIAGGGIAGMAAGLGFARAGWQVEIVERAETLGEVGAGLQLSPNACKVLDWLGVLDDVADIAFRPQAAVLRDGITGIEIFRTELAQAAEKRWGSSYLHVHRADLLRVLAEAASRSGVSINLGVAATQAVRHATSIVLHGDDGKGREADLVIGADGIRSRLRSAINPAEQPRFTGQIAWRGLVPVEALPKGLVAPEATVWAGDGRHVVTYYVRGGALVNLVAVIEAGDWTDEDWSAPGTTDELAAAFAGWHPGVAQVLEAATDVFLWGLFDRPEQVRWTAPRLALIGDAAHPMLPFMAQGAAQGLEDVAALVRHARTGSDPTTWVRAWEDERWPRVTRVLHRARANGRLFHHPPGLGRSLARAPIALVNRYAPGLAAAQLDWLYGFDPVTGTG